MKKIIITAVLACAAIVAASAFVGGTEASACQPNDPGCGG